MIKVTHESGYEKVYAHIEKTGVRNRKAVRQFFFAHAKDLRASASQDIRFGRRRGVTYYNVRLPNGRIKRRHRASSAKQTHANLSGAMLRTLGWKVHGVESMEFGYGTGGAQVDGSASAPPHAKWVVEGTNKKRLGDGLMKPRPDLKNAIRKTKGSAKKHWSKAIKDTAGL